MRDPFWPEYQDKPRSEKIFRPRLDSCVRVRWKRGMADETVSQEGISHTMGQ